MTSSGMLKRLERLRLAVLEIKERQASEILQQLTDEELDELMSIPEGGEPVTPGQVSAVQKCNELGFFTLAEDIDRLMTPEEKYRKERELERQIETT